MIADQSAVGAKVSEHLDWSRLSQKILWEVLCWAILGQLRLLVCCAGNLFFEKAILFHVCCLIEFSRLNHFHKWQMDCIYIVPLSKAMYNLCLSFTHSHTHSHTNSDWLPCKAPTSLSGAIEGSVSCSETLRHAQGGIKPATLRLPDDSSNTKQGYVILCD